MSEHGFLRGNCPICHNRLKMGEEVSALQCGHTFHFECLTQWLGVKKECPNCRKKVTVKSGVIKKLFFDTLDGNETLLELNYMEKAEKLAVEVKKLKDDVKEKEKKCEEFQKELKTLEKKIEKEKKRYDGEILTLKERNQHLETMEKDLKGIKKELKSKASEFYRNIFEKNDENVESAMQKFLQDDGHLNMKMFFRTMKKQDSKLKTERSEAIKEAERLRHEMKPIKKEMRKKEDVIKALREEVENLRREKENVNKEEKKQKKKKRKLIDENQDATNIENRNKVPDPRIESDEQDIDDSPVFRKTKRVKKRRLSDLDKSWTELNIVNLD